ncbi:MAG: NADH-quinone oxidoreductase subunit NuoF [Oscillospiraceae bacterium]|nr:NADH-quinone oxidoreductase subunit NuoF [Oscillospiraceae bacterium]
MNVIKTIDELNAIKAKYADVVGTRIEGKDCGVRDVLVCGGTGCTSSGSMKIVDVLQEEIKKNGLENKVNIIKTGCFGLCALGPIMIVYPEGTFYSKTEPEHIPEIVEQHLKNGQPVKKYLYEETVSGDDIKSLNETAFYANQNRVALRNCGVINPEHIEEYIARDGYQALHKCLTKLTPDDVIEIILNSGLRGRGGAGFPTGKKWMLARNLVKDADQKFVCCNADEGDPGAFMDRSVLEGDPHTVIEAMAIAGYAIGANQGYIYVRAEYPIAVERLKIAIKQAEEAGMLGDDIFGTGFKFRLGLRLGAGAFVCGEETALMTSIEGNRGEPRPRPPFPAVKGLFGKPTILNNVETYANVCQIILNGADWFASMGTDKSKGTKVFALGGKIHNTGLVEVPMGTTLRTVIEDIGGGIPNGKKFKAAQTGGPSGGCIPAEHLDIPIDYDNLISIGSMMGSGGLIVMDEDNCMVDIAKFFLDFTVDESCGKCTPCRIGTKRMYEMLEKITSGKATAEDLDKLEKLCYYIKDNALCGLGQTAPNPVLSTLRYFRDEYEAHINDKRCPAGVCKSLLNFSIIKDKCVGCGLCAKNCPASAISRTDYVAPGKKLAAMAIDTQKCVKCGACVDNCKFNAITKG